MTAGGPLRGHSLPSLLSSPCNTIPASIASSSWQTHMLTCSYIQEMVGPLIKLPLILLISLAWAPCRFPPCAHAFHTRHGSTFSHSSKSPAEVSSKGEAVPLTATRRALQEHDAMDEQQQQQQQQQQSGLAGNGCLLYVRYGAAVGDIARLRCVHVVPLGPRSSFLRRLSSACSPDLIFCQLGWQSFLLKMN